MEFAIQSLNKALFEVTNSHREHEIKLDLLKEKIEHEAQTIEQLEKAISKLKDEGTVINAKSFSKGFR